MLSPRRNSWLLGWLWLPLLACCQKADLTVVPSDADAAGDALRAVRLAGTGEGTRVCPYTIADFCAMEFPTDEPVWVVGYVVGSAPRSMSHAVFTAETDNTSNVLLSSDSLCSDIGRCIPVELHTAKLKASFSLPQNVGHFRKCLLIEGVPSTYLYTKGLRRVSTGLWMDGFDISSVAPAEWGSIEI